MKFRSVLFAAVSLAVAGSLAACGGVSNTNNSRNGVSNLGANNANNSAIVVNSNTNTTRWNSNISKEEYERDRARYEREKSSTETIGQGVNDSWLWFKTRSALAMADDLRDSTINVDVENDVVTLKGTVASAAEKSSAEKVAKEVEGVKSVRNQLTVAPEDSVTNMSSGNTNSKR